MTDPKSWEDKGSVIVRPRRSGDPGGLVVSVTLPSGQVLGERAVLPALAPTP